MSSTSSGDDKESIYDFLNFLTASFLFGLSITALSFPLVGNLDIGSIASCSPINVAVTRKTMPAASSDSTLMIKSRSPREGHTHTGPTLDNDLRTTDRLHSRERRDRACVPVRSAWF